MRSTFLRILAWGALAALVLVCLRIVSLAPLALDWGRELVAAAIAFVGIGLGFWFATKGERRFPAAADATADADTDVEPPAAPFDPATLTPRERRVVELLAAGLSNKEIARELSLSDNTIKTHLANVYGKLGARRRTEAVAAARRLGVLG